MKNVQQVDQNTGTTTDRRSTVGIKHLERLKLAQPNKRHGTEDGRG